MRKAIIDMDLNVSLIIPILEDAIDQERIKMQANEILQNESEFHKNLQAIAQTKILLSVLRNYELRS